jgi:hypothetical protein
MEKLLTVERKLQRLALGRSVDGYTIVDQRPHPEPIRPAPVPEKFRGLFGSESPPGRAVARAPLTFCSTTLAISSRSSLELLGVRVRYRIRTIGRDVSRKPNQRRVLLGPGFAAAVESPLVWCSWGNLTRASRMFTTSPYTCAEESYQARKALARPGATVVSSPMSG